MGKKNNDFKEASAWDKLACRAGQRVEHARGTYCEDVRRGEMECSISICTWITAVRGEMDIVLPKHEADIEKAWRKRETVEIYMG
jgi:hypothetical protein